MIETKPKEELVPASFIDKKLIKKLPKDKQQYWENRLAGKPGQDNKPDLVVKVNPSDVTTSLDNTGNIVVHNRESRRRRPFDLNIFTKATRSITKERLKHEKQKRNRAAAKARKDRQARYSQISEG